MWGCGRWAHSTVESERGPVEDRWRGGCGTVWLWRWGVRSINIIVYTCVLMYNRSINSYHANRYHASCMHGWMRQSITKTSAGRVRVTPQHRARVRSVDGLRRI